eukprot:jgi/Mesvir1/6209/Mv00891-RA.1
MAADKDGEASEPLPSEPLPPDTLPSVDDLPVAADLEREGQLVDMPRVDSGQLMDFSQNDGPESSMKSISVDPSELAGADEPSEQGARGSQEEAPAGYHCHYFDVGTVSSCSESLLHGLAEAAVEKSAGTFRDTGKTLESLKEELMIALRAEAAKHPDSQQSSQHLIPALLTRFAASQRGFMGKVSSVFTGDVKGDRIEETIVDMQKKGTWIEGQRETFAKELIKILDSGSREHCEQSFDSEAALHEHKAVCPWRPSSCENPGCFAVFSAAGKADHEAICPFELLPCTQKCDKLVRRGDMGVHCATSCDMKLVACPYASVGCASGGVHQGELEVHMAQDVIPHMALLLASLRSLAGAVDTSKESVALLHRQLAVLGANAEMDLKSLNLRMNEMDAYNKEVGREMKALQASVKKSFDTSAKEMMLLKEDMKKAHSNLLDKVKVLVTRQAEHK